MTWNELEKKCDECKKCPLSASKNKTVFGCGNREADIMFVGEAPGETEDNTGVPFTGLAGKHLDRHFRAVGIDRDDVYICNILKCRPPHNRDPQSDEQDACFDFLREQIRLVSPKIIVCLGRIAAIRLIDENFRITKDHGKVFEKGKLKLVAVYHPSALLRDPRKNEDMYRDLLSIKKMLQPLEI